MAKQRTKRPDDAAEGAVYTAGTGVEKDSTMVASEKGGVPAAAEGDVVISAPVHCDGCARKLRRSLQRLDGVGEVAVDSRANTVVLSGPGAVENAREALRIVERKTGRKATLLNPAPDKLPPLPVKSGAQTNIGDDITEVVDTEMVVLLRINLHCDACCEEIKRRMLKIEGVKEAAPLLKSSQMMVKGMVEPATLVGFIHRSTGRKAAIIRAEPLDLLPATKPPPMDAAPPPKGGADEAKHAEDPPVNNPGEKKDGHDDDKEMRDAPQDEEEENIGEGEEEHDAGEKLGAEKPSGHHEAPLVKNGGDGVVLESHKKDDHLFRAPLPAGVVAVAPEKMALMNGSFDPSYYAYPPHYYYPSYAPLHHYYPYQCAPPPSYPYNAYGPPVMYGYPHGTAEAFSEENPKACTIV